MSDIRFNTWLHRTGSGGVYQDSSGRVGIGTSVPTSALSVVGVVSATGFVGDLSGNVTGNVTSSGVTTITTLNATSIVGVSTAGMTTAYINTLSGISTISSDAAISINQNLVFASGKGIDFSATANSSGSMTSELLADYEEGTWTPEFQNVSGNPLYVNNSLTIFRAHYVKVGNLVYVYCYIQNDASFSYASGNSGSTKLFVGGLPFTASNASGNVYDAITVGFFQNWTGWSAGFTPMGTIITGSDQVQFFYANPNGVIDVTATFLFSPNSAILFSGWYLAA